jgi:hypothetical protein
MNIKEIREILNIIEKLDPKEAKALLEQASDEKVSDEQLGQELKTRITKITKIGTPTSLI